MERWNRADIENAPYNPRTIDDYAKKKLRENLKRVGLVQPLVVNKTTGHLVSGHQRLAAMDALEKSGEYLLDVSVVEMDKKTEMEQNAFMNNPSAQGTWDVDALSDLVHGGVFDWQLAGFDKLDLEVLIADLPGEDGEIPLMSEEATEALGDFQDHAQMLHQDRLENKGQKFWDENDAGENDLPQDETALEERDIQDDEYKEGDDLEKEREEWRALKKYYINKKHDVDDPCYFLALVFSASYRKGQFIDYLKMQNVEATGMDNEATKDVYQTSVKYLDGDRLLYNLVSAFEGPEVADEFMREDVNMLASPNMQEEARKIIDDEYAQKRDNAKEKMDAYMAEGEPEEEQPEPEEPEDGVEEQE